MGSGTRFLEIQNFAPGDAVAYDCAVSNGCGAATSAAATLYVDCAADFNCSLTITVQDIFAFLAAWFAGNPHADINGGGLSVTDIFAFLTHWFAGC